MFIEHARLITNTSKHKISVSCMKVAEDNPQVTLCFNACIEAEAAPVGPEARAMGHRVSKNVTS